MANFNKKAESYFIKIKNLPFILLGEKIKAKKDDFRDLRMSLRKARIPMSYEMYLSNAFFYSALAGIIGALIGLFIAYIILSFVKLPERLTHLTFSPSTAWLLQYRNISLAFFTVIILSIVFGGITYMLFLIYPGFMAGERKGSIDKNLPYASRPRTWWPSRARWLARVEPRKPAAPVMRKFMARGL